MQSRDERIDQTQRSKEGESARGNGDTVPAGGGPDRSAKDEDAKRLSEGTDINPALKKTFSVKNDPDLDK